MLVEVEQQDRRVEFPPEGEREMSEDVTLRKIEDDIKRLSSADKATLAGELIRTGKLALALGVLQMAAAEVDRRIKVER